MNARMSHEAVNERLPWFVNGTLPEDEYRQVEAHLDSCAACREDLAASRELSDVIRSDQAIPIPPTVTADDVLRRAGKLRAPRRTIDWRMAAAAAAMAIAAALAYTMLVPQEPPNQQFTTVTGSPGVATVSYVFELHFAASAGEADRRRILNEIGGSARAIDAVEGVYQLTLDLPPQALADLEALAASMAMRDEIAAADVVALQVPVR